ncbi:MAG: transketolase [Phycisphaerae bacterium SM23_33]|nr:MAG: transketolase [Phycisphaerae bacterium SM23_33]
MRRAAWELRLTVVEVIHRAGSGHVGGSLSCAEILTVLYDAVLRVRPAEPDWPDRDRFVLSKGHAAPALYATLARKGFFDAKLLETLRRIDGPLEGHPSMRSTPGVDMSTGSLGMGISVGVGMALAARATGRDYRVFVLCGDGELQEGQNWEGLMAGAKWRLSNLIAVIDRNHVQLDGPTPEVMPLGDLPAKLAAFGWRPLSCDGHDVAALLEAFQAAMAFDGPAAILAETVKGKGVSFMEGQAAWHGRPIGDQEYVRAMEELRAALK